MTYALCAAHMAQKNIIKIPRPADTTRHLLRAIYDFVRYVILAAILFSRCFIAAGEIMKILDGVTTTKINSPSADGVHHTFIIPYLCLVFDNANFLDQMIQFVVWVCGVGRTLP